MSFSNSAYRKEMMESATSLYFTSLQPMESSPFLSYSTRKEQGSTDGWASPRMTGRYSEIEQMWDDRWYGAAPIEGAVESMLQERPSAITGILTSLSLRSKPAASGKAREEDGQGSTSVLGSIKKMINKGRVECVDEDFRPRGSGPCEAFADWPIPRYPDDYEWDE